MHVPPLTSHDPRRLCRDGQRISLTVPVGKSFQIMRANMWRGLLVQSHLGNAGYGERLKSGMAGV